MRTALCRAGAVFIAAAWLGTTGCEQSAAGDPGSSDTKAVFGERKAAAAAVSGFTWDPEAFWYTLAMCGQPCAYPPLRLPGTPILERSVLQGSMVALFDPLLNAPGPMTAEPTKSGGGWEIAQVAVRSDVPFFAFALPPPAGVTPLKTDGPPDLPPVPPAGYLPTLSMKPIVTRSTSCMGQVAAQVSTGGVLEAVAKYLTATGTSTTVGDFVDPTKFGGVAVIWGYQPGPAFLRVPAFAVRVVSSGGTLHMIDWAPPQLPDLPPQVTAIQSSRGFFVNPNSPVAPYGVAVVTLPPLQGPPSETQLSVVDDVTDAETSRPWAFPPLPPVVIAPGIVSFLELQGLVPGSPPPPEWVCLP